MAPAPKTTIRTPRGCLRAEKTVSIRLSHPVFFIKVEKWTIYRCFATFKTPQTIQMTGRKRVAKKKKGKKKKR